MLRTLFLGVWSLLIIGINLIPPGVVWYVLERVTDRTEVLIVTLAGVLYAMINFTKPRGTFQPWFRWPCSFGASSASSR